MNENSSICITHFFEDLSYDCTIEPPPPRSPIYNDTYVSIRGLLSPQWCKDYGSAARDVHIYIHYYAGLNQDNDEEADENFFDITNYFLEEIQEAVDSNPVKYRAQYKAGLDQWLIDMKKMNNSFPGGDIFDAEREAAIKLKNLQPLSRAIAELGNGEAGWKGTLHLFNFIHTYVDIPPVSLRAVAKRYNSQHEIQIDMSRLPTAKLTVSTGKCRKFLTINEWMNYHPPMGGGVSVIIDLSYKDPIDDVVTSLVRRMDKAEAEIEKLNNELQRQQTTLEEHSKQLGELFARIAQVEKDVLDHMKKLTVLSGEIDKVNKLLEILGQNLKNKLNSLMAVAGPKGTLLSIIVGETISGVTREGLVHKVERVNKLLTETQQAVSTLNLETSNITQNLVPSLQRSIERIKS